MKKAPGWALMFPTSLFRLPLDGRPSVGTQSAVFRGAAFVFPPLLARTPTRCSSHGGDASFPEAAVGHVAPLLTGPPRVMATFNAGATFWMVRLGGLIERERFVLQARLRSCRGLLGSPSKLWSIV